MGAQLPTEQPLLRLLSGRAGRLRSDRHGSLPALDLKSTEPAFRSQARLSGESECIFYIDAEIAISALEIADNFNEYSGKQRLNDKLQIFAFYILDLPIEHHETSIRQRSVGESWTNDFT